MVNDFKEFYCPICKEWVLIEEFEQHRNSKVHVNDVGYSYPNTFEEFRQRFEMIGFYNERIV